MCEPAEILRAWPAIFPGAAIASAPPGFSGAVVHRVESRWGEFALRGWPPGAAGMPTARLAELHRWLSWLRDAGIATVPVPLVTGNGSTLISRGNRRWQLEPWMPGTADFHREPSDARLRNISIALAQLHVASERYVSSPAGRQWFGCGHGPAPAVTERLVKLRALAANVSSAPLVRANRRDAEQATLYGRLATLLPHVARRTAAELERFIAVPLRLHPCLRDVWRDHVLLTGEAVTGIIDLSATRVENAASDLSRLLGSLLGDDFDRWEAALDVYSSVRALSESERQLARVLDRSGVVLSAVHWQERMSATTLNAWERARADEIAGRLASLAARRD